MTDNESYFFVLWHMQLYMSWYIRSFFGFTFSDILYFFKYSCTNIFHRRSLYTFYQICKPLFVLSLLLVSSRGFKLIPGRPKSTCKCCRLLCMVQQRHRHIFLYPIYSSRLYIFSFGLQLYFPVAAIAIERYIGTFMALRYEELVTPLWVRVALASSTIYPLLLNCNPGPLFTKKTPSYQYMDSHYKPLDGRQTVLGL